MFLCSVGAQAQNAVLYGLIDASGSHSKDVGGDSHWRLDSGNMQYSFLGFRGSEDLGGGLRAVFKLESYVSIDSGSAGRNSYVTDPFWARESSVGLSGSFGTTVLGRTESPLYRATINFNPFGESPGFSPSARQYYGARGVVLGDSRWNNSISYTNNASDAPLRIHFGASLPGDAPSTPEHHRNYGLSVAYITGPFAAVAAAEKIQNSALALPAGFDHQTASIGYDYFLSKHTDIYVAAMAERLSFSSSGNSFAGGVRLRF